jgi:hypothetical protein
MVSLSLPGMYRNDNKRRSDLADDQSRQRRQRRADRSTQSRLSGETAGERTACFVTTCLKSRHPFRKRLRPFLSRYSWLERIPTIL